MVKAGSNCQGLTFQSFRHRFRFVKEGLASCPLIHFIPVMAESTTDEAYAERIANDEAAPSAGALLRYTCPVYVVSPRARARDSPRLLPNFVIAIELPSAESADHWILRGACALCSI